MVLQLNLWRAETFLWKSLGAVFYPLLQTLSQVGILLRIIMIVWTVWGRFGAEGMAICFSQMEKPADL